MNKRKAKFTYDEIDKLLESYDKDGSKDIKLKFITEEELQTLLKTP
ncbi:hypothetical protein [Bacillus sp. Marseille-P3661]|nr:hypothetical protein [Bacillus sp. Marseille-P3661]